MTSDRPKRNIRVTGKRRPFDADNFVCAVILHAEQLAKQGSGGSAAGHVPETDERRHYALRPIRDGKPWTDNDLTRLRVLREMGRPDGEIARRIGRTEAALVAKITELNKSGWSGLDVAA